jgi:hypothetical protein
MSTSKENLRLYRAAKKELHELQERERAAGITHETPEYLRLNRRVNELAKNVPWVLR